MASGFDSNNFVLNEDGMLGFGLLICKQISEKYGGKLEFISEYNIGSTFAFSFEIELNNDIEI